MNTLKTQQTSTLAVSAALSNKLGMLHELHIHLQPSYPIYIGHGIYDAPEWIQKHINPKCTQILIVSNQTVAPLYITKLENALTSYFEQPSKLTIHTLILPDGENYKNFEELQKILDTLLALNFDRYSMLIALGGGVIGDIVGFAASIYQRGIDFIQMPSTLLAQVDSSVGGKTAINHARGKNMIGAFWQPKAVISDVELLNTLDDRTFASGIAEMIKHGIIYDSAYLDFLEANAQAIQAKKPKELARAIEWACEIKCAIVAADEKESSIRAYLNLGHTFGHAIEAIAGYGQYLHGEAVAIGMNLALKWSVQYEGLDASFAKRMEALLQSYHLPIDFDFDFDLDLNFDLNLEIDVDVDTTVDIKVDTIVENFLNYMKLDKKNHNQQINLILVKKVANVFIKSVQENDLKSFLKQQLKQQFLASHSKYY